jgi:hypothetical protein
MAGQTAKEFVPGFIIKIFVETIVFAERRIYFAFTAAFPSLSACSV